MCGISGLANRGDRETLALMTAVQTHRGPNDGGLWDHRSPDGSYIGLGSRRLSILDLSADGHMPMSNEDGRVWITYNGEIYNFGIKPFYYAFRGGRLAFASEAKALLEVPEIEARIDLQALDQYLTFLWVPDPKTLFEGILKLGAGHRAMFRDGRLEISQYWDLSFPTAGQEFRLPEDHLAREIEERFRHSVEQQMVSDVPLGAFLSAGLDSS